VASLEQTISDPTMANARLLARNAEEPLRVKVTAKGTKNSMQGDKQGLGFTCNFPRHSCACFVLSDLEEVT